MIRVRKDKTVKDLTHKKNATDGQLNQLINDGDQRKLHKNDTDAIAIDGFIETVVT